ncbi:MAG: flavin reductase family protein [Eubacterium sp.]|nr:flavin reductase family protein [Eubacterium sp.]
MGKESWKPGNMLYPVPAVMVSCQRPGEKANIVTVAWAGTICSDPAMLSISVRPERYSYDIISETKEFVVNLVTTDLTRACDWCGVRSGRDYDKFKEMKLTEYKSEYMDTPAIEESPVNIYCKVKKIEKLGSHHMFIAEVVGVTVDDKYMDEKGRFDLRATNLMAYSHGEYFALGKKLGKFGYSVKKNTKGSSGKSKKSGGKSSKKSRNKKK